MVWGAGWFAGLFALFATMKVTGILSIGWEQGFFTALKGGVIGCVAGAAFSSVIRFGYYDRRLSDINWIRFGLFGGVVAALLMPLFMQTMNFLFGGGMVPWSLVLDDIPIFGVLGGVAAGGSLKIAQHADVLSKVEQREKLDSVDGFERLPSEE